MRRGVIMVLAIGACDGARTEHAEHAPLHFDVVVTQQQVDLRVVDPARPDAFNQAPFAHPGECDVTTDAWFCDGDCPGEWIGALRLEQDGTILSESVYDYPFGGGVGAVDTTHLDHAQLVIADQDGFEIAIPIPDLPRPVPTIDDIVVTGAGTPQQENVATSWHTEPPATSTVVELGGGFGGPRCHETRDADVTSMQADIENSALGWMAYVTAFATPSLVHTDFGDAEVWVGAMTWQDVPRP